MMVRHIRLGMQVMFLLLCFSSLSRAQTPCQDQGCIRPTVNPGCYTCGPGAGYACNLTGTCASSCTEIQCQAPPPPPAGGGGGGGGGGECDPGLDPWCANGCDPTIDLNCVEGGGITRNLIPAPFIKLRHQLLAKELVASVRPQVACKPPILPKNILFTL